MGILLHINVKTYHEIPSEGFLNSFFHPVRKYNTGFELDTGFSREYRRTIRVFSQGIHAITVFENTILVGGAQQHF